MVKLTAITLAAVLCATTAATPARAEPITIGVVTYMVGKWLVLTVLGTVVSRAVLPPGTLVCAAEGGKLYSVAPNTTCMDGSAPNLVK